jgi:hypothetical protein
VFYYRLIVHKLQAGEIDGLTMMFTSGMQQWAKLSEIPEMKRVAQEIAEEESRAVDVLSAIGTDDQTFSSDMYKDDVIPLPHTGGPLANHVVKEFVNDDGIRHVWDTELDDWVVAEAGDDSANDEEGGVQKEEKKTKETSEFFKELDDGKNGEKSSSALDDNKPEKRKRKKKKKSNDWSSSSNMWVYVNNLPLDVTIEEIKNHFSKVSITCLIICLM